MFTYYDVFSETVMELSDSMACMNCRPLVLKNLLGTAAKIVLQSKDADIRIRSSSVGTKTYGRRTRGSIGPGL